MSESDLSVTRYCPWVTIGVGCFNNNFTFFNSDKTNRDSRYQRRGEYINVSHEESSLEVNEEDRFKDTRIKRYYFFT